jgi:hypothetical protein
MVREFNGYRIAIYSPSDHFAVITRADSNAVIDFKEKQRDRQWWKAPPCASLVLNS